MAFVGFDIEISNIFDLQPGEDLNKYAPFDISVAATHIVGGGSKLWFSRGPDGKPLTNLSREQASELLDYLEQMQSDEHSIVAWNGLSFDLRWIGYVAGDLPRAGQIALKMYDPMFQFFKLKGFPVSLAAVGKGMGIETTKSMQAADAPRLWQAGEFDTVCKYVEGDAQMTVEIVSEIQRSNRIAWITKKRIAFRRTDTVLAHCRRLSERPNA